MKKESFAFDSSSKEARKSTCMSNEYSKVM